MVKWAFSIKTDLTALEAAVEAVDNTVAIHIVPVFKDNRQQYGLAIGSDSVTDGGTP
jgi:hypothetical protein